MLLSCRCGVSVQVLEGDLGETLSETLAGLLTEVKVVGSERDYVVPLEELAMRTLHSIYQHRQTGGELHTQHTCRLLGGVNFSVFGVRKYVWYCFVWNIN